MKIKIFLIVLFLSVSNTTFAQYESWSKAEVYLLDGTIMSGEAKFPIGGTEGPFTAKEKLRFRIADRKPVKLIDASKIEKVVLKLSYTKRKKGKKIKMIRDATFVTYSVNKKKTKKAFAELIIDGKLKLLKKVRANNSYNRLSTITITLLVKNDDLPIVYRNDDLKSFKNQTINYLQDCPSLLSKLEDETFKSDDIEAVINYYNDNCAK